MPDKILASRQGCVLNVTLNRPEKRNALDGDMYDGLREAFEAAALDQGIRVVLLGGSRGAFTAGNDLDDFASWSAHSDIEQVPVVRLIRTLIDFAKTGCRRRAWTGGRFRHDGSAAL